MTHIKKKKTQTHKRAHKGNKLILQMMNEMLHISCHYNVIYLTQLKSSDITESVSSASTRRQEQRLGQISKQIFNQVIEKIKSASAKF